MAAKKNKPVAGLDTGGSVPPAAGAESGEQGEGTGGEAPPSGGDGSAEPPPSDEQRIRDAAARKLEEQTGNLSVRLSKSEARANGLQGELDRERAGRKALEQQVGELTVALAAAKTAAQNAGAAIAGLTENARQLNESVTIASGKPGVGKGGRLHAKQGDVLIVTADDDEVAELQQKLGIQTSVYRVSADTLDDLDQSGFLYPAS